MLLQNIFAAVALSFATMLDTVMLGCAGGGYAMELILLKKSCGVETYTPANSVDTT